jgi:hypothetical protein
VLLGGFFRHSWLAEVLDSAMILLPAASAEATVLARGIMAQRVVRLRLNVGGKPFVYSLS